MKDKRIRHFGVDSASQAPPHDDDTLIREALRIAEMTLRNAADAQEQLWPTSLLIEKFRMSAERMSEIRAARD